MTDVAGIIFEARRRVLGNSAQERGPDEKLRQLKFAPSRKKGGVIAEIERHADGRNGSARLKVRTVVTGPEAVDLAYAGGAQVAASKIKERYLLFER